MSKTQKITCTKHGGNPIGLYNYYIACPESIFSGLGHIPICKKCLYDIITDYYNRHKDMRIAMYYMCRKIDVAFYEVDFEGAYGNNEDDPVKTFQSYMRAFNSLGGENNKWFPFDYSDDVVLSNLGEDGVFQEIDEDDLGIFYGGKTKHQLTNFWGLGFSDDDLTFLESEYERWTTRHKCDEYSEEILYKEICLQILDIRKDRAAQKDVTKKLESLQKLMTSANVKPADAAAIKSAENVNALGLWTRDIEQYRPAEYFDKKGKYADFDGFKDYIERLMLRPLKNLLAGSRDFDSEFSINNTGDLDE